MGGRGHLTRGQCAQKQKGLMVKWGVGRWRGVVLAVLEQLDSSTNKAATILLKNPDLQIV